MKTESSDKNWYSLRTLKASYPKNVMFGITDRSGVRDSVYPNRSPRKGSTVIWVPEKNAHVGIASYVDAHSKTDEAALTKIAELGIPLGINFGYRPSDDLSSTWTAWKEKTPRAKKAESVKVMKAEFPARFEDGTPFAAGELVKIIFRKNYVGTDKNGKKRFENVYVRPTQEEIEAFAKENA